MSHSVLGDFNLAPQPKKESCLTKIASAVQVKRNPCRKYTVDKVQALI